MDNHSTDDGTSRHKADRVSGAEPLVEQSVRLTKAFLNLPDDRCRQSVMAFVEYLAASGVPSPNDSAVVSKPQESDPAQGA